MKIIYFFSFVLFLLFGCQSKKTIIPKEVLKSQNYMEVVGAIMHNERRPDSYPMYPDGPLGVHKHILETTQYPSVALENYIEGKVVVRYIIDTKGMVSNAEIIESVSSELDQEALRVVKSMQRWHPGYKNNEPVNVFYDQPILFELD